MVGGFLLGAPQPALPQLTLDAFRRHVDDGATVIDTRPVDTWAAAHIPGVLAIPLRAQFASWLGWLVERDARLAFVIDADQDRAELVRQCHQIGYDRIVGELTGGMNPWTAAGLPTRSTRLADARQVRPAPSVLDVRQDREHAEGHVPGVSHVELGRLPEVAGQLDDLEAVMCGHGERAATAASLLERVGRPGIAVIVGGPADWATASHESLATG